MFPCELKCPKLLIQLQRIMNKNVAARAGLVGFAALDPPHASRDSAASGSLGEPVPRMPEAVRELTPIAIHHVPIHHRLVYVSERSLRARRGRPRPQRIVDVGSGDGYV